MALQSTTASSPLVRLLAGWAPASPQPPAMDFAERLSLWLGPLDAIGLQAAHQQIRALPVQPGQDRDQRRRRAGALAQDLQRVRATLAGAIAQDPLLLAQDRLGPPAGSAGRTGGVPQPAAAAWNAFAERHQELQRQMELVIAPLRTHVREALGRAAPRLRQLAALDAVWSHLLGPREQGLLPGVAGLLRQRFEQLRRAAAETAAADQAASASPVPDEWLARFALDWREALLAELDLRLAPTAALVEALADTRDD